MRQQICTLLAALWAAVAFASELQSVGVADLRQFDPSLTGTGVLLSQPEAGAGDPPYWQVNPAAVGQPESLFTWIGSTGSATNFPNSLGFESGHADFVGNLLYGSIEGVVPGLAHVANYDGDFFYTNYVQNSLSITGRVVNQSFIFVGETTGIDSTYDRYADLFNTLFVSGVGNGGAVNPPATCYNGIGVAAYGGSSSTGPTTDGRSKPDIAAPGGATSFSTPLVCGAAAILLQAGLRGDGGANTASAASDVRTLKALLLNGARKTMNWTHTQTAPLDPNFGAGLLNVYTSYGQLRGGKRGPALTELITIGDPHPAPGGLRYNRIRRGWDFGANSSSTTGNGVNHYGLEINAASPRQFDFTGTLVWNLHAGQTAINDLNLYLYNVDSNLLVASSESLVDNVEHIYATNLPPGRYDLQVLKRGGLPLAVASNSETYALAYEFGPPEPSQFTNVDESGSQFATRLTGEPEHTYIVERTGDFNAWTRVSTNMTSAAGYFDFSTPANGSLGFFRALRVP